MKYNPTTGLFYKSEDSPNIIGSTQSGKQILGGDAEAYSRDFDSEDHRDAKKVHTDKVTKLQSRARMSMLQGGKFNHKLLSSLSAQASHHSSQADWHHEAAEAETNTEGVEKSCGIILNEEAIASLIAGSQSEQQEHWSTIDIALEKGRGPDKHKRKKRGEGSKPMPGEDTKLQSNTRYRGYSDAVLGQDKIGQVDSKASGKKKEAPPPPSRTIGTDELPSPHYSKPNNQAYRTILGKFGEKVQGVLTYNHHTDQVHVLDQKKWNDLKSQLMGKQDA